MAPTPELQHADIEQRSRRPVRPLPLHLAEDRCCRSDVAGARYARYAATAGRLLAARARSSPRYAADSRSTSASTEPPAWVTSRSIASASQGGERYEGNAASTSSAWVSGFTRRSSFATLPSASITKVDRSTPM